MRKVVVYTLVLIIFLFLLVSLAFYSAPFMRGGECIRYANQHTDVVEESYWISRDDFQSLRIVNEEYMCDGTMITVKTKPSFSLISWNKIAISYRITATINEWETWAEIGSVQQQRKIIFVFSDFKWIVEEVILE